MDMVIFSTKKGSFKGPFLETLFGLHNDYYRT